MTDDFDLVIAGGGIGALTAALNSARTGRSTVVLDGPAPGGQLLSIERIDGFPGFPEGVAGYELCPMLQEQAVDDGAEFAMAESTGLEPDGEAGVATARATCGPGRHHGDGPRLRTLGSPGEERLRGKGVSHCASCDGPLLRARTVGVVGGGDSALQEALTLAEVRREVIVLHRGDGALCAGRLPRAGARAPEDRRPLRDGGRGILGEAAVSGVRMRDPTSDDATSSSSGACSSTSGSRPTAT